MAHTFNVFLFLILQGSFSDRVFSSHPVHISEYLIHPYVTFRLQRSESKQSVIVRF